MHKYLILGAGMGKAIAAALLQQEDTECVTLVDCNSDLLEQVVNDLNDDRLLGALMDITAVPCVKKLMRSHDVTISAVKYEFNVALTKAAIEVGTHFIDLGGNNTVVKKQFSLDAAAKNVGSKISPYNGVAPGAVNVFARYAMELLGVDTLKSLHIYVGGLDQFPIGPIQYSKVFSVNGLLNEYIEDAVVIEDGEVKTVPGLSESDELEFERFPPEGIERCLESAVTSGVSSTLVETLRDHVTGDLRYSTLRFPGHWEKVRMMRDLGLFRMDKIRLPDGSEVTPREVTEAILEQSLPVATHDFIVMRIIATTGDGDVVELELVDEANDGLTAMQRCTGFSAAVTAMLIAKGVVTDTGVLYLEQSIPPTRYVQELGKLGIHLKVRRPHASHEPREA